MVSKILKSEEKVNAFFEIMKQTKKHCSGYMGRTALQRMLEADKDHYIHTLHKKLSSKIELKMSEIKLCLRVMTNYYLKNIIIITMLTSSKLDKTTMMEHLRRARAIYSFLNHQDSPYIY